MSDLDQIKANCAKYGQQRNQLEDQINRDYQNYRLELKRIYNSALESVDKNIKHLKIRCTLMIIISVVIGIIMIIIAAAVDSGLSLALGFIILVAGCIVGFTDFNRLESVKIERMENINLIKTEINKVFPGLIQL